VSNYHWPCSNGDDEEEPIFDVEPVPESWGEWLMGVLGRLAALFIAGICLLMLLLILLALARVIGGMLGI
jgi:hypothetical protein